MDINSARKWIEMARVAGISHLKVNGLEFDLAPLSLPPSDMPEEIQLQVPTSDELLFGHTGMMPEAMGE